MKFKQDMDAAERSCGILVDVTSDPVPPPRFDTGLVEEYLGEAPDDLTENDVTGLPPIVDAFDLVATEMIRPPELIEGLIHKGSKMVVGGGSKSFKTWIQLSIALCVASGKPWLGRPTARGRVLFINFEIQESFFQERIGHVAKSLGIDLKPGMMDVWNLRGYAASYNLLVPQIIARIKDAGYVLVILDPIYKVYGNGMKDENSASDVAQLMNSLETICTQTGAALIFGAHHSKGNQAGKESIDRIGGSGVYARDPDSIMDFTHHEEEGCFVVTPILRNLPPVEPFTVRWCFPLMQLEESLDPSKLKVVAGRKKRFDVMEILAHIDDTAFLQPLSISEWADRASMKRKTLADYLPELRSKGYIATAGEGHLSRQYITEKGKQALKKLSGD